MRALITGGGGFLGRYIVKQLLEKDIDVRILCRSTQDDLVNQGVEVVQGDILHAGCVETASRDCDVVFHVAAKAGVWGREIDYFNANVVGTRNVFNACHVNGIKYLVHTSTPSVVFSGKAISGEDEEMPYGENWLCAYAKTKAQAEKEVLAENGRNGLKVIAIRPHLIWGVGDPHLFPRVIERGKLGKLKIVGEGQNKVDISHVENVAFAHILAMEALMKDHAGGKAYFISQDDPVVLWDWLNQLLQRLEIKKVERRISFKAAYLVGAIFEFIYKLLNKKEEPLMTRFVATELAKDHYFNISSAKKDLGYYLKVSTEEGLNEWVRDFEKTNSLQPNT